VNELGVVDGVGLVLNTVEGRFHTGDMILFAVVVEQNVEVGTSKLGVLF